MRAVRALVLVGAVLAAGAASAAGAPALRHPNPLHTNLTLDYESPIATLEPLSGAVVPASVDDLARLRYRQVGAWGGFLPAPVRGIALGTAFGGVRSFLFPRGHANGGGTVVVSPPATAPAPQPRQNGCFAGCAPPPRHHQRRRHHKASFAAGNCGTAGLSIRSDLPHCRIHVLDRRPGQGTFEHLTIRNTSASRYVLSFRAAGSRLPLWSDLRMGIWRHGSPPPAPLPPLRFWTARYTRLATLAPGRSVHLTVELYLPRSVGNAYQHHGAVVDFDWRAAGFPRR